MATLRYKGAIDAVVVPLEHGGEILCVRGVPVDVPDDLASRLLEQSTWESAQPPVQSKPIPAIAAPAQAAPKEGSA